MIFNYSAIEYIDRNFKGYQSLIKNGRKGTQLFWNVYAQR